ncbi:hypothetical protein NicSoilB4_17270 [Arthrobacter sp. NicSoilB4]|uniref:hypothetical protein n=1 Tax=Arthrobacter sp. NicSoilB4 TaxID=2830997 RepID=UPI001CC5A806|nr:hypothetical protein [Arthrobacter sp. NicSoilB4]BCW66964.1 hypothetical protein NicSoilB4_17270 [Arthrobacter sp. NicSoilB4]
MREVLAAVPGRPLPRRRPRSLAALPACVVLLASAQSGCASSIPGNAEPPCFPPAFSVAPSSAKPGERVTVTAPDAVCNPRYGGNARIQVTVTDAAGVQVLTATAPMNDGGSFGYGFDVPAGTAAGEAGITAMPFNIDWCDDTGRNNRVPGAGAALTLERVSCVIPTRPLTIIR